MLQADPVWAAGVAVGVVALGYKFFTGQPTCATCRRVLQRKHVLQHG